MGAFEALTISSHRLCRWYLTLAPAVHDAFLSYSQSADSSLAAALERGLESLAKPLFRLRAIDVFRDKTGLSASPGLWSGIAGHLEASRWLIFLASPKAATSPWCTKELLWWLDRHGNERLLIVLTDGALVRDADARDFDWGRTDALPDAVRGRFAEEPLYVDLRWARDEASLGHRDPRLRPALLDLAAPIRGVPKDILATKWGPTKSTKWQQNGARLNLRGIKGAKHGFSCEIPQSSAGIVHVSPYGDLKRSTPLLLGSAGCGCAYNKP
jgi:hypothetical protein